MKETGKNFIGSATGVTDKFNIYIHIGQPFTDFFVFQKRDFLLQQLAVEFKTYGVDVSGLLGTQQIAGSADLQIA